MNYEYLIRQPITHENLVMYGFNRCEPYYFFSYEIIILGMKVKLFLKYNFVTENIKCYNCFMNDLANGRKDLPKSMLELDTFLMQTFEVYLLETPVFEQSLLVFGFKPEINFGWCETYFMVVNNKHLTITHHKKKDIFFSYEMQFFNLRDVDIWIKEKTYERKGFLDAVKSIF